MSGSWLSGAAENIAKQGDGWKLVECAEDEGLTRDDADALFKVAMTHNGAYGDWPEKLRDRLRERFVKNAIDPWWGEVLGKIKETRDAIAIATKEGYDSKRVGGPIMWFTPGGCDDLMVKWLLRVPGISGEMAKELGKNIYSEAAFCDLLFYEGLEKNIALEILENCGETIKSDVLLEYAERVTLDGSFGHEEILLQALWAGINDSSCHDSRETVGGILDRLSEDRLWTVLPMVADNNPLELVEWMKTAGRKKCLVWPKDVLAILLSSKNKEMRLAAAKMATWRTSARKSGSPKGEKAVRQKRKR